MNHIKKTIKAIGEEPLELLRNVEKQVIGEELKPNADPEIPQDESNYKKQVAEQDGRRLQALESELKDIRDQKRINELKKQEEAVKNQDAQTVTSIVIEPTSKRGRKMGGGQKGAAKRETTRVEKPVPPSG